MDSCRIVSPPHPRVNEHAGDPLKNRYEAASPGFSRRWVIEDLATTGHSVGDERTSSSLSVAYVMRT
jgi:hypothetical protein